MIEKIILDYLTAQLTVPVYMEIPSNRPNKFIVLRKLGGGLTNGVKAATIAVETYANSLYDSALLNEIVKEKLLDAISLDTVTSSNLGGESSNIDTATKSYRYESIFNFYYY